MSAEERDAIRDLCEAVAELAAGTVHLLGTGRAGEIIGKVLSVSRDMDSLDQEDKAPNTWWWFGP